jgi:hypothetical protein
MVFNFGSGIKAFGGYIYNLDFLDEYVPVGLQVSLNGGSFVTTETPSSATTFYGFISDSLLSDATISLLSDATIARSSDFCVTAGSVIVGTMASAPQPRRRHLSPPLAPCPCLAPLPPSAGAGACVAVWLAAASVAEHDRAALLAAVLALGRGGVNPLNWLN